MIISDILVDCDLSQKGVLEIAINYLPEDVKKGNDLCIVSVGSMGACRLPEEYRLREIVFLSDWIFPPAEKSEADDAGRFFIITLLHEVAHAVYKHGSPALDKLTHDQIQSQEDEADMLAISWFNQHIEARNHRFLKKMGQQELREIVGRYASIYNQFEKSRYGWHQNLGT